jgi:hypothetical protein
MEDVLSAGYILTDYNERFIQEILDSLVPENSRFLTKGIYVVLTIGYFFCIISE